MTTNNLGLVPLVNFGEITDNLYRSAQPLFNYQYDWLRDTLKTDIIVNLRSENTRMDKGKGMVAIDFAMPDHQPPPDDLADRYIAWLRNQHNLARILIHCEHGHGRTSTFSVLSKLALGWSLDKAIEDEHERFHYEFRHKAQIDWLKDYAGRRGL